MDINNVHQEIKRCLPNYITTEVVGSRISLLHASEGSQNRCSIYVLKDNEGNYSIKIEPSYTLNIMSTSYKSMSLKFYSRLRTVSEGIKTQHNLKIQKAEAHAAHVAERRLITAELTKEYGDYFTVASNGTVVLTVGGREASVDPNTKTISLCCTTLRSMFKVPLDDALRLFKELELLKLIDGDINDDRFH